MDIENEEENWTEGRRGHTLLEVISFSFYELRHILVIIERLRYEMTSPERVQLMRLGMKYQDYHDEK